MEWKCGYCDSKSIHYKVTDIKNLTSSGNVKDLRDIQEIFSKDEHTKFACTECIENVKSVPVAELVPLPESQTTPKYITEVENFVQNSTEEVNFLEVNGVILIYPDSKMELIMDFVQTKLNGSHHEPLPVNSDSVATTECEVVDIWSELDDNSKFSTSIKASSSENTLILTEDDCSEASSARKSLKRKYAELMPLEKDWIEEYDDDSLMTPGLRESIKLNISDVKGQDVSCKICGVTYIDDNHGRQKVARHILKDHLGKNPSYYDFEKLRNRLATICKLSNYDYQCLICKDNGQLFKASRKLLIDHLKVHKKRVVQSYVLQNE